MIAAFFRRLLRRRPKFKQRRIPAPPASRLTIPELFDYWNGLTDEHKQSAQAYVYRAAPWPDPQPTFRKFTAGDEALSNAAVLAIFGPGDFLFRVQEQFEHSPGITANWEVCVAAGPIRGRGMDGRGMEIK